MGGNRYQKGQIYKIVDNGYQKCYIGSTTEDLSKRMARHRNMYNLYQTHQKKYYSCFSLFDEFGIENCKIQWIENYPCNSKKELEAREGKHIQENECINKRIAGRTKKQYVEQEVEKIKQTKHTHYIKHKETILEKVKEYQTKNKEQISQRRKEQYQKKKELKQQNQE